MTNSNLPKHWESEEYDNWTLEEIQKDIEKTPGYSTDEKHKPFINFNDAVVLIRDFPDKNLRAGYVCVFEGFTRDKNEDL